MKRFDWSVQRGRCYFQPIRAYLRTQSSKFFRTWQLTHLFIRACVNVSFWENNFRWLFPFVSTFVSSLKESQRKSKTSIWLPFIENKWEWRGEGRAVRSQTFRRDEASAALVREGMLPNPKSKIYFFIICFWGGSRGGSGGSVEPPNCPWKRWKSHFWRAQNSL